MIWLLMAVGAVVVQPFRAVQQPSVKPFLA